MVLIRYSPPYDWPLISGWLRARAIEGVEVVSESDYRRDGVIVRHEASQNALNVPRKFAVRARRLFDVDADPRAIHATFAKDKLLAPRLRKRPGVRVPGAWDPFELAIRAIVGQQISVAGARTILGRIASTHGIAAERLADVTLDGMPRRRAETIRLLARAFVSNGGLPSDLASIPGIGPWTAQYIAMRLGDADAFPASDLILRRHAGNLTERELLRRAEAWRPFRAYGAMLLWTTPA